MTKDKKQELNEITFDGTAFETDTTVLGLDTITTTGTTTFGDYTLQSSYSTDTITINGKELDTSSITTVTLTDLEERQLELFENDSLSVTVNINIPGDPDGAFDD